MADDAKKNGWFNKYIWGSKEENQEVSPNQNKPEQGAVAIQTQVQVPLAVLPAVAGSQEIDQKYVENFLGVMHEADFPGPDYYELFIAVREMQNDPEFSGMSIAQIIKLCFKTLKVQGLTIEFLNESSQKYVKLLEQHYEEFIKNELPNRVDTNVRVLQQENQQLQTANDAVSGQIQKIRTDLEGNLKSYEQQIAQIQQKITTEKNNAQQFEQKLNSEAEVRKQKIAENQKKIEEENSKIQKIKAKFDAAYGVVLGWIKSDQEVISQIK